MRALRLLAGIATLVALLALGAALGDFASDPSPLGAVGLLIVVAAIGFALARLYGPQGVGEPGVHVSRAVAAPEPRTPTRRRPRTRASVVEEGWTPPIEDDLEPEHLWASPEDDRDIRAEERRRRREHGEERRRLKAEAKEQRRREAAERRQREAEAEAEEQRRREAEAVARREREAEAEAQRRREEEAAAQRRREAAAAAEREQEEQPRREPAAARSTREPKRRLLGRRGASTAAGLLDLNRAAAHEIAALPGVGPASGQRIVEDRRLNGPFTDVYELTRVEGFSDARVRRFADKVTV